MVNRLHDSLQIVWHVEGPRGRRSPYARCALRSDQGPICGGLVWELDDPAADVYYLRGARFHQFSYHDAGASHSCPCCVCRTFPIRVYHHIFAPHRPCSSTWHTPGRAVYTLLCLQHSPMVRVSLVSSTYMHGQGRLERFSRPPAPSLKLDCVRKNLKTILGLLQAIQCPHKYGRHICQDI